MEEQVGRLKAAKGLVLGLAIVSTVFSLPLIGYLLSVYSFGIIHFLSLALAIVTLVFCVRASTSKTGAILVMIASVAGFVSSVVMVTGMMFALQSGFDLTSFVAVQSGLQAEELRLFFSGFFIGLVSWILYVVATILLYINYSKTRMRQKDLELKVFTPVSYSSHAREDIKEFNQSEVKQDDASSFKGKDDTLKQPQKKQNKPKKSVAKAKPKESKSQKAKSGKKTEKTVKDKK